MFASVTGVGMEEFQPSWVLVVTWINIAPYQNWRCRYSNFYSGYSSDDDDDYSYNYYSYYSQYNDQCRYQAEQSAAHVSFHRKTTAFIFEILLGCQKQGI